MFRQDTARAKALARAVLGHCETHRRQSGEDKWVLATEGDAHLLVGDSDTAMSKYREMLKLKTGPDSREIGSVYQQALFLLDHRNDKVGLERLETLFLETTL